MDSLNHQHYHHPHQQHQHQHHHHLQQQLIRAVKDSNFVQVEELLRQGVSADARDQDGHSVLYWACCRGHVDVCRRLLRRGCDVTTKGKTGTTALMACADNGQETCLRLLLQRRAIRLNDISDRGDTALHMAAYRGFHNIVQLLCMAGANVGLHNVNGQTPLGVARVQDNKDCIRILNNYGPEYPERLNGVTSPSPNGQRNTPHHSHPSLPPPPASNEGFISYPTNETLHLQSFDPDISTISGSPYNDNLLSSDSALGFSVHSAPSSSHYVSHYPQRGQQDPAPYTPNISLSQGHINNTNNSNSPAPPLPPRKTTNPHTFSTNPHSPIEMDERPFFNNIVALNSNPLASAQHSANSNGNEHPDSGHFSSGSNGYHNDIRQGNQSSRTRSSGVQERKDDEESRTLSYNSFQGSLSPSLDPIYPPSFTFATSGEDTSGPPAISYSPAENVHVKSIYSNAARSSIPTSATVTPANKHSCSINNLSSLSRRNEENLKNVSNYNIVSKSDTIQNYMPNVSPVEVSLKSQNVNPKELIAHEQHTDDTEVLPGLKMSSYLDSLQLKVVMLEESLDKEQTCNSELQNENKKLIQENADLKEVVQQLSQKLSKLS